MKRQTMISLIFVLCIVGLNARSAAQHCTAFDPDDIRPDTFINFLNAQQNPRAPNECVTIAIHRLEVLHAPKASVPLLRYLDYKRPLTSAEQKGYLFQPLIPDVLYPAISALASVGRSSLPGLLDVIQDSKTSLQAKDNAIFTVMRIHRNTPEGVLFLEQSVARASTPAGTSALIAATQRAVDFCREQLRDECKERATDPH